MKRRDPVQSAIVVTAFCAGAMVLQISIIGWDELTPIVLVVLILTLMGVYVVPVTYDVLRSYKAMTRQERRNLLRHFLPPASCLIAIVFALFWFQERWHQAFLDRTLYAIAEKEVHDFDDAKSQGVGCLAQGDLILLFCRAAGRSTEGDVANAIDRVERALAARLKAKLEPALEDIRVAGTGGAAVARDRIWESENAVVPRNLRDIGIRYNTGSDCGTWGFITGGRERRRQCVKRWALEPVDSLIGKARGDAQTEFDAKMLDAEVQADDLEKFVNDELDNYISGPLNDRFNVLRETNASAFLAWRWSARLALALQVFILLKALTLIYARLAFNPQVGNQNLSMGTADQDHNTVITVKRLTTMQEDESGIRYGFMSTIPKTFYLFHSTGLVRSRQGQISLPLGWKVSFGRFWHRKLLAYKYDPKETKEFGIYGNANATVLLVHLPPETRLAIRLNHLLGFTEGLDLGTRYEINLVNIMRGRVIFPVISAGTEGGMVLLYAAAGTFGKMTPDGDTAPSEALVAFDPAARMQVEADTTWPSAYVGEYAIRPSDEKSFALYAAAAIPSPAWLLIRRFFFLILPLPL